MYAQFFQHCFSYDKPTCYHDGTLAQCLIFDQGKGQIFTVCQKCLKHPFYQNQKILRFQNSEQFSNHLSNFLNQKNQLTRCFTKNYFITQIRSVQSKYSQVICSIINLINAEKNQIIKELQQTQKLFEIQYQSNFQNMNHTSEYFKKLIEDKDMLNNKIRGFEGKKQSKLAQKILNYRRQLNSLQYLNQNFAIKIEQINSKIINGRSYYRCLTELVNMSFYKTNQQVKNIKKPSSCNISGCPSVQLNVNKNNDQIFKNRSRCSSTNQGSETSIGNINQNPSPSSSPNKHKPPKNVTKEVTIQKRARSHQNIQQSQNQRKGINY